MYIEEEAKRKLEDRSWNYNKKQKLAKLIMTKLRKYI